MKTTHKIIVAEDDPNLNWVYQSLLEDAGYQVHVSPNGLKALDMVHQLFPDLVLVDVIMPSMDGFELAEALRGNPATSQIPIIFISGLADQADRERAERMGIDQYLAKPVQVKELLEAVRNALKPHPQGMTPSQSLTS